MHICVADTCPLTRHQARRRQASEERTIARPHRVEPHERKSETWKMGNFASRTFVFIAMIAILTYFRTTIMSDEQKSDDGE